MTARTVPAPPVFTFQEELTSSIMNQLTTWMNFWSDPPMFRMYQTAAQPIANATNTQVTMDTADYDTDSGRAVATPWSYTIPVGMSGRWRLTAAVLYQANATGVRLTSIEKNGFVLPDGGIVSGAGVANVHGYCVTVTPVLAAGDVISVWTFQNSGGSLSTNNNSSSGLSYFEGKLESLANP